MRQNNVAVGCAAWGQLAVEPVLGILNQRGIVVHVVLGVDIVGDDVVAQRLHDVDATGFSRAFQVGRTHVRREPAKDVAEGHFVVDHLGPLDGVVDLVEIAVRPGVACNLVTCIMRSLQDGRPGERRVINVALSTVVASDEEGGFDYELVEKVEDLVGVNVRAVVKGQGNQSGSSALGDDGA